MVGVENKDEFRESLVREYASGKLASVDVFSHSFEVGLNFGGYGEDPTFDRSDVLTLPTDIMTPDAVITLWGCNAGNTCGMGVQNTIAEALANVLKATVRAMSGPSEFVDEGRADPPMTGTDPKRQMQTFKPNQPKPKQGEPRCNRR